MRRTQLCFFYELIKSSVALVLNVWILVQFERFFLNVKIETWFRGAVGCVDIFSRMPEEYFGIKYT